MEVERTVQFILKMQARHERWKAEHEERTAE